MPTYEHLRILDAASASASAPFYFKSQPLQLDPTSSDVTACVDGAVGAANPAHPLDLDPASIGLLVSFGCTSGQTKGYGVAVPPEATIGSAATKYMPAFANGCTDPCEAAESYRRVFRDGGRSEAYHRVPAPRCYDGVELNRYDLVPSMREASEAMFAEPEWQEKMAVLASQIVQIRFGGCAKV